MKTKKILTEQISDLTVASLPTRPTSEATLGGRGYTAKEMKEAFDKLPLFIVEKFNSLLDDITSLGEGSVAAEIPTGISEGHSLSELFRDLTDGNAAAYINVLGKSLALTISEISERLSALERR